MLDGANRQQAGGKPLRRGARSAARPREARARRRVGAIVFAVSAFALLAWPAAGFADRLYWSDAGGGGVASAQIRSGALGGGAAESVFSGQDGAGAIALNPAAGTIYWADPQGDAIKVAPLDGQGTPQTLYSEPAGSHPTGIAISAAAGKLYWTDAGTGEVRAGALAGGVAAQTLYSEPTGAEPAGIAVSSSARKLYWADSGSAEVRAGALSGAAAAQTLFAEPAGSRPSGVAIDAGASRLYWTDEGSDEVRFGSLGGKVGEQTAYAEAAGSLPRGLALAPPSGGLYWADSGSGMIRAASLGAAGLPLSLFAGEAAAGFPVVLAAPAGASVPKIAGRRFAGETLTCGKGKWASNLPGASFYRAPQSLTYSWQLEGSPLAGAAAAILTPSAAGAYTCSVTAANAGGEAVQVSAPAIVKARPPVASISAPANGGIYTRGQIVRSAFACAEGAGGPGLASCKDSNGDGPPAGYLNTAALGARAYTVTAVSRDGRRASARITYTVIAPPHIAAPAPPHVAMKTAKARVARHRARIVLACAASGRACNGRLTLSARVKRRVCVVRSHRQAWRGHCLRRIVKVRTIRFAPARYRLAPGARKQVSVHLGKRAMKLLRRARHRRLAVRAKATVAGGRATDRRIVLALRRALHPRRALNPRRGA